MKNEKNKSLLYELPSIMDKSRKEYEKIKSSLIQPARSTFHDNLLFCDDNLAVMKELLQPPYNMGGKINLIYIDPPYNTGKKFYSKANGVERLAYVDKYNDGVVGYLEMITLRLFLMRDLLAEDGSIYVHCDWRVSSYIRLVLDEIFGKEKFRNEIIWHYSTLGRPKDRFALKHDTIFVYGKNIDAFFNEQEAKIPYSKEYIDSHFRNVDENGKQCRKRKDAGKWRIYYPDSGMIPNDVWDIPYENSMSKNRVNYPTQKPEKLLERIIKSSSKKEDIVADFFCGSGTTLAVAEKLGRKWMGVDNSEIAIQTTRKRLNKITHE